MEDLQNQIKQDIETARHYLAEHEILPFLTSN
jgi:hypothetical protein